MVRLVWVNRIYTKNFITDFLQTMRNIVGGRMKAYERMLDQAVRETHKEFQKKYPTAQNLRLDTEHMTEGSIMVVISGQVE